MKTCYIFAAAEGMPTALKIDETDIVIAADAGFKNTEKLGISSNIILGDFDSLGYIPKNCEIIKHPIKKDDTDTLLAIKLGLDKGYKRFVLYGCLGGRLDHTLANLQSLNYIAENGGIGFICGDDFCATAIKNSKLEFAPKSSGNISVFAATSNALGVTIKGLLYETDNTDININFPIGVSNEFIGKNAYISVNKGTLTIVWSGEYKDAKADLF